MQDDAQKYQPFLDNFVLEVLDVAYSPEENRSKEAHYVKQYDALSASGYNVLRGNPASTRQYWFLKRRNLLGSKTQSWSYTCNTSIITADVDRVLQIPFALLLSSCSNIIYSPFIMYFGAAFIVHFTSTISCSCLATKIIISSGLCFHAIFDLSCVSGGGSGLKTRLVFIYLALLNPLMQRKAIFYLSILKLLMEHDFEPANLLAISSYLGFSTWMLDTSLSVDIGIHWWN